MRLVDLEESLAWQEACQDDNPDPPSSGHSTQWNSAIQLIAEESLEVGIFDQNPGLITSDGRGGWVNTPGCRRL